MIHLHDPHDFETAYKQYFQMLVGFAYQYVADSEHAADIVQEVFGKIWNQTETTTIRTTVKSYLFGAVRNACLNHLRHQKVKQAYERENTQEIIDGESFLEMDELEEKLSKALEALPDKRRHIFELSRFEGKKYAEIAKELDISIKTVETQMSRALKTIREALSAYLVYLLIFSLLIVEACKGKL